MINKDYVCKLGLEFIDEYWFDNTHHFFVFKHNNICVIVDDNIYENKEPIVFDYSKYCEMQKIYGSIMINYIVLIMRIMEIMQQSIKKEQFNCLSSNFPHSHLQLNLLR